MAYPACEDVFAAMRFSNNDYRLTPEVLDNEVFPAIAESLVRGAMIVARNTSDPDVERHFVFREIEFYYLPPHGEGADPFAHGDDIQRLFGKWYFHRTGKGFKGGTYKGLDLTFGDNNAYGGILIRSIEDLDTGDIVDGSCLVVNTLLEACGCETILDCTSGAEYFDAFTPSHLFICQKKAGVGTCQGLIATPRVGLTLNARRPGSGDARHIMRHLRFVERSAAAKLKKGRPHTIIALAAAGASVADVHAVTGGTRSSAEKYILAAGDDRDNSICSFYGTKLNVHDVCRLYGVCHRAGYV